MDATTQKLVDHFGDVRWRLNNLYWVTDKSATRIKFELNWAQDDLFDEMHYLNIILKARQLGFTTFIQLFMLDACVFNSNVKAATVAHTLPSAQEIFDQKVKYPYDNMPEAVRQAVTAKTDSTNELAFSNNSSLRVATSLRSGTLQYLHISEHGKICAKYPDKAIEIRTGALNTVEQGNMIFIESTAEGQAGDFFEMCERAQTRARMEARLTPLDFKFMFFPWWKHPEYRLDPEGVVIPASDEEYYAKLESEGIVTLDAHQKAWYTKKMEVQQEHMKREFPSTPKEAFEAAIKGAYYSKQIALAEKQGRIGRVPYDEALPVHTFWDIGRDSTSIWFAQFSGPFIRIIDFYENDEEGLPHYVKVLRSKPYQYGKHWGPHDIRVKEWGGDSTRVKTALRLGIKFKVAPNISIDDGIDAVRSLFSRIYFDEANCDQGLRGLRAYRKEWDTDRATWKDSPHHDWASHPADAFRYLCLSYKEDMGEAIDEKPKFLLDQPMNTIMEQHFRKQRKGRQMGRYG